MSHYDTLGVSKTSTKEEIKKAYRRLALTHHPDKGGDVNTFNKIQEAYEVLSDDNKRKQYDVGPTPFFTPHPGGPHHFNPFDIFKQFNININSSTPDAVKLKDIRFSLPITLEESIKGIVKNIPVTYTNKCDCVDYCSNCKGAGYIFIKNQIGPFVQNIRNDCSICNTRGIVQKNKECELCNGSMFKEYVEELVINIPAGVPSDWNMRLSNKGTVPMRKQDIQGDLIVDINIMEDPYFKREGNNLVYVYKTHLSNVLIGVKIEVDVFGEKHIVNINSTHLQLELVTVKNKGITWKGITGDLIIKLDMDYKLKQLDEEQLNMLKDTFEKIGW
jgi:molecular chaperone DnaJ